MADRHTTVFGDQIDVTALGAGLVKDVDDNLTVNVDDSTIEIDTDVVRVKDLGITNAKLAGSITDDKLASDYIQTSEVDGTTIEFNEATGVSELKIVDGGVDTLQLADEAVTEGKIDMFNSPTLGYVLGYTSNGLEWVANTEAGAVLEADVIVNEIPTGLINSLNVTYTLANTPVAGTVAVFLNGLYQAPGVGLDYTISGTTITFVKAPRTNSDLYVTYIIDN